MCMSPPAESKVTREHDYVGNIPGDDERRLNQLDMGWGQTITSHTSTMPRSARSHVDGAAHARAWWAHI